MSSLNNLQLRIIAGVAGSTFIIGSIVSGKWGFFGVFLLMALCCLYEFYKLVKNVCQPNALLGIVIGTANLLLCFYYLFFDSEISPVWFVLNLPMVTLVFLVELYRKSETPFQNIAFTILGVIYIALPFCLLLFAANSISVDSNGYSYQFAIGSMLMLWANDTGAYAAGRTMGKTKLFERISPKKTWEGAAGGLLLSLLFAYGCAHWFQDLALIHWIVLSIITVIIGSYGDLVESMLKRSIQIKDSGSIIPGHGGFLDRFDGLLLALPFTSAYVLLFIK